MIGFNECFSKNFHFLFSLFFFLDLPATFIAIAIACLRGFPSAISVRRFSEMSSLLFPLRSGIFILFIIVYIPYSMQSYTYETHASPMGYFSIHGLIAL